MALTQSQKQAMTISVSNRIVGTVLGREESAGNVERSIAAAAVALCNAYAPEAPMAILTEASTMLGGWMYGTRPHLSEESWKDPSGTETAMKFQSAATKNGMRNSGASAMLSRYVRRRGGRIGGASTTTGMAGAAGPVQDIGLTVMRLGFTSALPFTDNLFRWVGTANGVQIDTAHAQPAAFGFWLPGNIMSRVVAVVLLRSVPSFTPFPDAINLDAFEPAIRYEFGNTAGMLRHTPVTFRGNFGLPNDFRCVIGQPL